jgi:DNA primase large subunit
MTAQEAEASDNMLYCDLTVFKRRISNHNIFWIFKDYINMITLIRKWDNPTIYKLNGRFATAIPKKDWDDFFLLLPHDAIMMKAKRIDLYTEVSSYTKIKPTELLASYYLREEKIRIIREREQTSNWVFIKSDI